MGTFNLEKLMNRDESKRDAFLARLLGIFSEKIVYFWCKDDKSKYSALYNDDKKEIYRPSFYSKNNKYLHTTLDFCFVKDEKIYISEMKCEIQFQDYKFLTLSSKSKIDQIAHHKNRKKQENDKKPNAFERFLYVTQNPTKYEDKYIIKVNKEKKTVHGGILVWGRVDEDTKEEIMSKYKFADILSLEDIVNNLIEWKNQEYISFINQYAGWCEELFKGFKGESF